MADLSHVIRLLFLTGCRAGEIGGLVWEEVDFEKRSLAIPANRTKTHEPLYLPLVDTAVDILKRVERRPNERHVFGIKPGCGLNVIRGEDLNSYILKVAGELLPDWRIHDIRRTVRSKMGEIGIEPHIAERVVNHIGHRSEVDRIYDRYTYGPQILDALTRWEAHLLRIVGHIDVAALASPPKRPERKGKWGLVFTTLKKNGSTMSVGDIAAATKVNESYVRGALAAMVKTGEVVKIGPGGGGPGRHTRYICSDNQPQREIA
jgi:hypothetical protein